MPFDSAPAPRCRHIAALPRPIGWDGFRPAAPARSQSNRGWPTGHPSPLRQVEAQLRTPSGYTAGDRSEHGPKLRALSSSRHAPAPPPPRQVAAPPPQPKPPRRSPASPLESRDGLPSVAQRQLLEAEADNATAPSTWLDAMTWAHRNKVPLGGTEAADLRATNQARRAAGLPPYRIVERRGPPERLPAPTLGRDFEGAAA